MSSSDSRMQRQYFVCASDNQTDINCWYNCFCLWIHFLTAMSGQYILSCVGKYFKDTVGKKHMQRQKQLQQEWIYVQQYFDAVTKPVSASKKHSWTYFNSCCNCFSLCIFLYYRVCAIYTMYKIITIPTQARIYCLYIAQTQQ